MSIRESVQRIKTTPDQINLYGAILILGIGVLIGISLARMVDR